MMKRRPVYIDIKSSVSEIEETIADIDDVSELELLRSKLDDLIDVVNERILSCR